MKFEILNAQEEFLSDSSLEALKSITKRLSEGVNEVSQEIPLAQFLKSITQECNEQLQEPQQRQAKPAQQIIGSVSSASAVALVIVVQTIVSSIFTIYQDADGIAKQRALLETLSVLFQSAIELFGQWTTRGNEVNVENPLIEFKDQFSDILGQALMGSAKDEFSFRITALKGFLRLSVLRDFFQDNEIGLFVQYLDEILLQEETAGRDDLKKEAISALAELSKHKPQLIIDITFPAFVATLPDEDDGTTSSYLSTLDTLAQISVERDIFETLFRRLFSKLSILLQKDQPGSAAYPRSILMTILYVMQQRKMDSDPNVEQYFDKIVIGLSRSASETASGHGKNKILSDPTVLDTLGRLCNLLVRSVSSQKQVQVAENVYSLFSSTEAFVPVPFSQGATADQERTIILSTYLIAGLSKDCASHIPHTSPDITALLSDLVQRATLQSTEPAVHLAFLRHLALLVNKFMSKQDLHVAEKLFDSLVSENQQTVHPEKVRVIFWLAKALVLRLAPTTTHILNSLLDLLSSSDQKTSNSTARGFVILLGDDDVLSATNGASIRLLSKQRVFATVIPLISSRIREVNVTSSEGQAADHIKPAHLTALAGILSTISPDLVLPELPTLLPLLLQSLDLQTSDSVAVRAATLDTLGVIIRENGVAVIEKCGHVHSLVQRLLKTTELKNVSGAVNPPRLRVDSLKCLYLLATKQTPDAGQNASIPASISPLLPEKALVLRSLRAVLDDPKRDVRKAAVDARGAWLRGVDDAPEEED